MIHLTLCVLEEAFQYGICLCLVRTQAFLCQSNGYNAARFSCQLLQQSMSDVVKCVLHLFLSPTHRALLQRSSTKAPAVMKH